MRRGILLALAGLLAMGTAGGASAATLDFTGTLQIDLMGRRDVAGEPIYLTVPGAGAAQVTDDGNLHLLSFTLPGGTFGPTTITRTVIPTFVTLVDSFRFTLAQNLSGSFSGISGGPPGGGTMGLSGTAKVCLCVIHLACTGYIPLPLTPTTGGAGFGLGGTRTATGPYGPNVTLQNAPWTIGQPTMTLHTPNSTVTIPVLPGGFAHGPASFTSSTARPGGALQLVTATKVYTNWVFPSEFPLTGILNLRFVPEPGTLLLLGSGVAVLAAAGRRRSRR